VCKISTWLRYFWLLETAPKFWLKIATNTKTTQKNRRQRDAFPTIHFTFEWNNHYTFYFRMKQWYATLRPPSLWGPLCIKVRLTQKIVFANTTKGHRRVEHQEESLISCACLALDECPWALVLWQMRCFILLGQGFFEPFQDRGGSLLSAGHNSR